MMKNNFIILCLIISISYSLCAEEITFTITQIKNNVCLPLEGKYSFYIYGTFSSSISISDKIYINLKSPFQTQAECSPFSIGSDSYFTCEIDVCFYTLYKSDILLPLEAPIDKKYKFVNWKDIIGKTDGETNLIENSVICIPNPKNTFIPSKIESKGCSGTNNLFIIKGDWKNAEPLPELSCEFKIRIDNDKNGIAECNYNKENTKEINCKYGGEGKIQFQELIFKGISGCYTMKKADISIEVDKCNEGGYISKYISLYLMLILGFMIYL